MRNRKLFRIWRPIEVIFAGGAATVKLAVFPAFGIRQINCIALRTVIAVTIESIENIIQLARRRAQPFLFSFFSCFLGPIGMLLTKRERDPFSIWRPAKSTDRTFGQVG